ncbi:hypothetical protein GA8_04030 [Geobacillus sp. A8]|nr:hypothetical protein GA8_04030 [Geobacillus sp. A8]
MSILGTSLTYDGDKGMARREAVLFLFSLAEAAAV